jgi:hypothetical protein
MACLRTVLSYQFPSDAEIDKSYLESQGLTVFLMNNLTTRNLDLGLASGIVLQVSEEEWPTANRILREARPDRFGSVERVNAIDREIKRGALGALLGGVILAALAYLLMPGVWPGEAVYWWMPQEKSILTAFLSGAIAGWRLSGKFRRQR